MKATRLSLALALAPILIAALTQPAANAELAARVHGLCPVEDRDWSAGAAVELQARHWNSENMGVACSLGFGTMTAVDELIEENDAFGSLSVAVGGETALVPVGLSALLRGGLGPDIALVAEAGLRYVFIDSAVIANVTAEDAHEIAYVSEEIQIDDTVLAVIGFTLTAGLAEGVTLEAGVGYQVDMRKPHEWFLGEDVGPTSFQAASGHFGLAWAF